MVDCSNGLSRSKSHDAWPLLYYRGLRCLAAERRSCMLRSIDRVWIGVDAWLQANCEKLVSAQHDGSTVPVEQTTTVRMGQIAFSPRLVGYRSVVRDAGSLPLILGDIIETFDATRARADLQLCAEIGANGQAIPRLKPIAGPADAERPARKPDTGGFVLHGPLGHLFALRRPYHFFPGAPSADRFACSPRRTFSLDACSLHPAVSSAKSATHPSRHTSPAI